MKNRSSKGVTGRDPYIITQALAYASEWLRSLGLPFDEPSNRHDMDMLLARYGAFGELHRHSARNKLRNRTIRSADEWNAIMQADRRETTEYLAQEAREWSGEANGDVDDCLAPAETV